MLYDYECSTCGHRDEVFDKMDGEKVVDCPECREHTFYRLIGTPANVLNEVVKDLRGTPIWFPSDGKPYYDIGLGKTFNNKKEKAEYMKKKGVVMDGSTTNSKEARSFIEDGRKE